MIFKKLLITVLAIAGLVYGAVQLQTVPMPHFENLCGEWG